MKSKYACLVASVLMSVPLTAHASIIWSAGPSDITFSKAAFADFTLAANQDRITGNVWITRGATQGIFNFVTESAYNIEISTGATDHVSPQGTEWAFSSLNGNPTFAYGTGAANHASYVFSDWETAAQGGGPPFPSNLTNNAAVLHLIPDDIYVDLKFTDWGVGSGAGGSFVYTRAVPEPATLSLLALGGLALIRRRS